MAVIGEMHYLTIGNNTYSIPVSGGTVTSVRVQATSPIQSSSSDEQTVSLNTTISLADEYGDTKNPYGTKTANYILAGPTSGSAAAPTFRALTAADIPDLSASYLPVSTVIPSKTSDLTNDSGFITGYTETDPVFLASAAYGISASDISNWNGKSDFSGSYNDLTNKPTIPDAVSITRKTTTGTNIADITIGNTTTQLYAPSSGSGGTQVQLVRW